MNTETVKLILEGNGWDLGAVPINDWLPSVANQLQDSQPKFDILNDPNWYKDLGDAATAWFAECDNVMEFLLDNYDGDTCIKSMKTLVHDYQLTFAPMCMTTWDRFTKEHGTRLHEMAEKGLL